jgi:hypothetical protein
MPLAHRNGSPGADRCGLSASTGPDPPGHMDHRGTGRRAWPARRAVFIPVATMPTPEGQPWPSTRRPSDRTSTCIRDASTAICGLTVAKHVKTDSLMRTAICSMRSTCPFTAFHSSINTTFTDLGEPNGEPRRADACERLRTRANGKSSVRAQFRTPANPCERRKPTPQVSGTNLTFMQLCRKVRVIRSVREVELTGAPRRQVACSAHNNFWQCPDRSSSTYGRTFQSFLLGPPGGGASLSGTWSSLASRWKWASIERGTGVVRVERIQAATSRCIW